MQRHQESTRRSRTSYLNNDLTSCAASPQKHASGFPTSRVQHQQHVSKFASTSKLRILGLLPDCPQVQPQRESTIPSYVLLIFYILSKQTCGRRVMYHVSNVQVQLAFGAIGARMPPMLCALNAQPSTESVDLAL